MKENENDLAAGAFGRYNAHPPVAVTHDGKPVPAWADIPPEKSSVKEKWRAAIAPLVRSGGPGPSPEGQIGDLLLMHRDDGAVITFRWIDGQWEQTHGFTHQNSYPPFSPGVVQYVRWTIVGAAASGSDPSAASVPPSLT